MLRAKTESADVRKGSGGCGEIKGVPTVRQIFPGYINPTHSRCKTRLIVELLPLISTIFAFCGIAGSFV